MKICIRCKEKKHSSEFYNSKFKMDGKVNACKKCCNSMTKKYIGAKKEWIMTTSPMRRLCIGINCRGEKSFISVGGARLCPSCKRIISCIESGYTDTVIVRKSRSSG